jgi:hypothetical protein
VVVTCAQLLAALGTWVVSDHAENIYTARRLLTARSFDFAGVGEKVPYLPWLLAAPGQPPRPRLFPGFPIAILPFVAVDHALGLDRTRDLGVVVHFAGHVFMGGALALLGWTLRRQGVSQRATVAAILLVGLIWPVWQVSRRGGPEPFLALLVAAYLAADSVGRFAPRAALAAALPGCHPTGTLLAPVLALSAAARPGFLEKDAQGRRPRVREALLLLACAASGSLGIVVVWNGLYHRSFFGGYAMYGATRAILMDNPWVFFLGYVAESLLLCPVLLLLALLSGVSGSQARRALAVPAAMLVLFLILFALLSHPTAAEPARRLSVVWIAFAFAVGRSLDRLPLSAGALAGLVLLSMLNGFYWYRIVDGNYYPWYDAQGGQWEWEPLVLWITLAVDGRPFWWSAAPIAVLSLVGCYAAARAGGALAATPSR